MSRPITKEIRVRCSVSHAFSTFTQSIDSWWPASHRRESNSALEMEGRVGGRFVERLAGGKERRLGEVLQWEPPHRLKYSWYLGAITGPTEVTIEFLADGDHTIVHVRHAEGGAAMGDQWEPRAQGFTRAWSEVLPAFQRWIENSDRQGAAHE